MRLTKDTKNVTDVRYYMGKIKAFKDWNIKAEDITDEEIIEIIEDDMAEWRHEYIDLEFVADLSNDNFVLIMTTVLNTAWGNRISKTVEYLRKADERAEAREIEKNRPTEELIEHIEDIMESDDVTKWAKPIKSDADGNYKVRFARDEVESKFLIVKFDNEKCMIVKLNDGG